MKPLNKKKFLKNYRGILRPEIAYDEQNQIGQAEERFKNATFSETENKQMLREEINRIRNRYS